MMHGSSVLLLLGDVEQEGGGGGEPDLFGADFVNGVYTINGVGVNASDVIDHPEFITASGLDLGDNSGFFFAFLLGAFSEALTSANFTAVLEVETPNTNNTVGLVISNPSGNDFHMLVEFYDGSASPGDVVYMWDNVNGGSRREVMSGGAWSAGIFKLAFTRTDDKLVLSVNGGAIEDNTNPRVITGSVTEASLGGGTQFVGGGVWDNIIIRQLSIYPEPVEDSELPTLSTP